MLGDITVTGEAYLIDIDGNLVNANIVFEPVDAVVTGVTSTVDIAGTYQWDNAVTVVAPEIRGTNNARSYLLTITGGGDHVAPILSQLVSNNAGTWVLWDTGDEAGYIA